MSYMMYSRGSGDNNRETHKLNDTVSPQRSRKATAFVYTPSSTLTILKISGRELTVTALLPVVARQTVIALGPCCAVLALAETRGVAAVVDGAHLVAVAL